MYRMAQPGDDGSAATATDHAANTGQAPRYDMNSPALASTFGSHMLTQYLAHAQHEQYMYAAAVAAAADGPQAYTYDTRRKSDSSSVGGVDESPSPQAPGRDEENGSATPATSVTATSPRGALASSDTTVGDPDEVDLKRLESLSLETSKESTEKVYGLAIESS
jgi:hypothetical protein